MGRGAWRAIVHGVSKSWTQLSYKSFSNHRYSRDYTDKEEYYKEVCKNKLNTWVKWTNSQKNINDQK